MTNFDPTPTEPQGAQPFSFDVDFGRPVAGQPEPVATQPAPPVQEPVTAKGSRKARPAARTKTSSRRPLHDVRTRVGNAVRLGMRRLGCLVMVITMLIVALFVVVFAFKAVSSIEPPTPPALTSDPLHDPVPGEVPMSR